MDTRTNTMREDDVKDTERENSHVTEVIYLQARKCQKLLVKTKNEK